MPLEIEEHVTVVRCGEGSEADELGRDLPDLLDRLDRLALCPGGGELAVSLAGSSIIADVVGQTPTEFSGRVAHTFNVDRKPDGPIGSVVAQYDLRMTKR
jgi:hypothetical protein